jgi:hypothetical protein
MAKERTPLERTLGWIRMTLLRPEPRMRLLFGGLALFCLGYLIFGIKAWHSGVAEQHAAGKPAMLRQYMAFGFWWGALAVGIFSAILAATSRWWANARPLVPTVLTRSPGLPRRTFLIALAVIVVTAVPPRLARMGFSFWGDEAWAYHNLLHGSYEKNDDGSLSFKRHSWQKTAFSDKGLNNHYLFSLASRASDEIWRKATGAKPNEFSEGAVRVPPLIAGLLSIIGIAFLLRRMGFATAGLVAAALMAAHPWHIRYGSEARGYTMLIAALVFAVLALVNALESGRWRWWLTFMGAQFVALYTWKAAIHPVCALNVIAALIIVKQRGLRGDGSVQLGRWAVANVLTLMVFIPLFAPAIPQIQRKLGASVELRGEMDGEWFRSFWSEACAAMEWADGDVDTPFETVTGVAAQLPFFPGFLFIAIPVIMLLGAVILLRKEPGAGFLVLAPVIGGGLGFLHFRASGTVLLDYYLFYTSPFLIALAAIGLTGLLPRRFPMLVRLAPTAVYAAVFAYTVGPQVLVMTRLPVQDPRGASALTRYGGEGRFHLGPSDIVTVGLYRRSLLYDPRIVQYWNGQPLRTAELLKEVMRDCDQSRKSMRLSIANMGFARVENPDYIALVDDPRYFRPLGVFYGSEEYITIHTYEYIPGSVERSD